MNKDGEHSRLAFFNVSLLISAGEGQELVIEVVRHGQGVAGRAGVCDQEMRSRRGWYGAVWRRDGQATGRLMGQWSGVGRWALGGGKRARSRGVDKFKGRRASHAKPGAGWKRLLSLSRPLGVT